MTYEMVAALLGEKVRELRAARGLTQEDLAELAGLSRNQVQNIEHSRNNLKQGARRPGPGNAKLVTVYSLAEALKVDIAYLVDPTIAVHPVPQAPVIDSRESERI